MTASPQSRSQAKTYAIDTAKKPTASATITTSIIGVLQMEFSREQADA
jgi:hypothetical protein